MTEQDERPIRPLSVRLPPGERRNPVALARVAVGPLQLELVVSRLKKGGITVRSPVSEGGLPAIEAEPAAWAVIERAAIEAVLRDQAAGEHLFGPGLRLLPRPALKSLREAGVIPPLPSADVSQLRPSAASA